MSAHPYGGLPPQQFWPVGLEATSMAFFTPPGIERLYSGMTNSRASLASTWARNRSQGCGVCGSRSAL